MRSYEYEDGPSPVMGKTVKVFEDASVPPDKCKIKVSHSDFDEAREFFALLFLTTPTDIEAVKGHPRKEFHMYINPRDYDLVVSLFEDPTV